MAGYPYTNQIVDDNSKKAIIAAFDRISVLTAAQDALQTAFNALSAVAIVTNPTGAVTPLPPSGGGTGLGSFNTGDLLVADTPASLVGLPDVPTGNVLLAGGSGVIPFYGKVGLTTHVSGVLPIANGGTNATSFTGTRVPFFDGTRLVDDADLTFVTDTLTVTKVLAPTSVSTPSLISTGALTITPLAGQNLNVALSTTGDFAVNTNQLYVDTSTNRIGVGTTTPGITGLAKFEVVGTDSSVSGPHIQTVTSADVYPLVQLLSYSHDNIALGFDWYFNSSVVDTSSHAGSNFRIYKNNNKLSFQVKSGVAPGSAISGVLNAIVIDSSGLVGIRTTSPGAALDITSAVSIGLQLKANTADGSSTAVNILNSSGNPLLGIGTDGFTRFYSNGVELVRLNPTGTMGVGVSTVTAVLHLKAGTTAASSAPLKLTSGTVMTTAEAGAIEFTTDDFFATITTGAARKAFVLDNGARLTSGKIPVATTNGRLIDSTAALLIAGAIPTIVATTFERAETGTDANVLTYTVGGADEYLVVQVSTDVSALTGTSLVVTVTWKDSNNNTATSSITLSGVADGSINVPINAKASTNVVVSTVFVGVSTAYNISAIITRVK